MKNKQKEENDKNDDFSRNEYSGSFGIRNDSDIKRDVICTTENGQTRTRGLSSSSFLSYLLHTL